MDSAVIELGYIGLGVSDIKAWEDFAGTVVGLEVVAGNSDKCFIARADYWFHRVFVVENGADDLDFVGWRLKDEEAFIAMQEKLRRENIDFELAGEELITERQVLGLLTLTDPAGIPTEIFFGPRVEPSMPYYPGRPVHGGFVTGDSGVGHIAVNTSAVMQCNDFYKNILGMKGSIEFERQLPPHAGGMKFTLRFMSCNKRQHSIAFGDLGGKRRLEHFMMEVEKMEDVGLTRDIVKKRGIPIFLDIGQHHNDRVVSMYFSTPSGWNWECGWGSVAPAGKAEWGEFPVWGHEHEPPQA